MIQTTQTNCPNPITKMNSSPRVLKANTSKMQRVTVNTMSISIRNTGERKMKIVIHSQANQQISQPNPNTKLIQAFIHKYLTQVIIKSRWKRMIHQNN